MKLFSDYYLNLIFEQQIQRMSDEVYFYNKEVITDLNSIANQCFNKYKFNPVIIGEEDFKRRTIEKTYIIKNVFKFFKIIEVQTEVFEAKFYFPYKGDDILFMCQSSTHMKTVPNNVDFIKDYIVFTYHCDIEELQNKDSINKILSQLKEDYKLTKAGIEYCNSDVKNFNENLKNDALKMLKRNKYYVEQLNFPFQIS